MSAIRTLFIHCATLALIVWATGCNSSSNQESPPAASIASPAAEQSPADSSLPQQLAGTPELSSDLANQPPAEASASRNPFPEVLIQTNLGDIRLKLNRERAPQTVDNFLVNYLDRDFYPGTIFHYVEPDFLAIAGGYTADLEPKQTRAPIRNESRGGLKNVRGTIGMSRHPDYADSATSQFYINLTDNPELDFHESEDEDSHGYCVFGEVVAGMEVVDQIAQAEVHNRGDFTNVPVKPIVIESIERID